IEILGVEPDYMGRGIGRKLGKAILKIFKDNGIKIVYTAVRWDSGDLLSFFKNLGFERSDFINLERCIE
ncbi:MAG: GNAT family N-acetyltransferase, partial [Candidatus Thermoplasmatota archaeon]